MNQQQIDYTKAEAAVKFESLSIVTNGLPGGTKILLNGKEIKDLSNLNLSVWTGDYGSVQMEFTTRDTEVEQGSLYERRSYILVPPAEEKGNASISPKTASAAANVVVPDHRSVPQNIDLMKQI
jgi:hypothetical protein